MPKTKKTTQSSGKGAQNKKQTAQKSSAVKKSRDNASASPSFIRQAAPYILAAVALFVGVCVISGEGKIGEGIKNILTGLFGGAAYALPLFMLIRAIFWKRDDAEDRNILRTVATAVVFADITMLLHFINDGVQTWSAPEHFKSGLSLVGGGVVGGILGELFRMGFGKACSLIIIFASAILLSFYIAGLTPRSVYIYIAYNIKFAKEKRAERAEKRKNAPPTKSKEREEEYLEYLREKKKRDREMKKRAETEDEYNKGDGGQVPLPSPKPTVYKVKRARRIDPSVLSVTNDDGEVLRRTNGKSGNTSAEPDVKGPYMAEEFDDIDGAVYDEEAYTAAVADGIAASQTDSEFDEPSFDDRIFDEVMKRTRERIEKSRKTEGIKGGAAQGSLPTGDFIGGDDEGITEEVSADAGLDAVEIASIGIRKMNAKPAVSDDVTDTVRLASSVGDEGEIDLSKLFVNPEDAKLLEQLSAAYATGDSLGVKRSQLGDRRTASSASLGAPPEYKFPPIDILASDPGGGKENIKEELQDNAVRLVETLRSFNVRTKIEHISRGPTITRYELLPEPGTRVRSIVNLVDDIALNLATTGVRIEAPIPGKSAVGIEVPNKNQSTVHLRTLIDAPKFADAKSKLTVCLGEDVAGDAVYFDIAKMPHLLIAGATGMGKSVCINSIITSLLYKASPDDVKLILVDPKKVELSIYNGIPHLLVPVVSDPKKAAGSLSWAVGEMERRFALIEAVGVRDIKSFNDVTKNDPDYEYMPRIVIIIDELADLMMTAPDDVEQSICRLAQKARAAGMHLIIGTQRPSVDVITGLIKANIPSRIAFTVSSQIDSRTIIDRGGAENLIGRGDMLYNPVGAQKPMRVQGAYVSESDVEEVVAYIKNMNASASTYSEEVTNQIEREAQRCGAGKKKAEIRDDDGDNEDPMLKNAIELAVESGKISTSLIQRRLSLGYGRSAKLIDRMEQLGYVSAPDGQKPREVLITKQDFMEMRLKDEAPFDV